MVNDPAAELPALPRRISPRDFILDFSPRLKAALQVSGDRSLPVAACIEIEVEGDGDGEGEGEGEGDGGGVFFMAIDTAGDVVFAEGESADPPWAAIIFDRKAYDALLAIFSRWHRRRGKQGDLDALRAWLQQQWVFWRQRMEGLKGIIDRHPGLVELHVGDDLGDVHVITLEVGEPAQDDPFLRIALSLEDIPLDPHLQTSAALDALVRAKVRLAGNVDYIALFAA